ncbi:YHYH domain-containing protein [Mesorhizobium sp.]|nr:MAG: YHYH domain-containing protein [Mesorhizobium sp.]
MIPAAFAELTLTAFADGAHAHSSGTDSKGCHENHQTGDYHCH